jgi:hypothetical protein
MKSNVSFNHRVIRLACASALGVSALFASAGSYAASASANATAVVITPIAISKNSDISFGKFAANTGGTVVMTTAGARSATSTVVLSTATAGNAASFAVTGEASTAYSITLPGATTITRVSGSETMTVDTWTANPLVGAGMLSSGGAETLLVGATLTVGSGQVAGSYTGSFNVSVDYN